ncbi:kinesin-like protein KIF19 [Bubalus kerabau]|uniref:kinesin-like protein KIF19 n=1 Tax=Bubalus carabanensis TaxID=3119969 RepID=UPI00244ED965|nr:kinesin-like protein KIF19 [Bubalus carabanensis]
MKDSGDSKDQQLMVALRVRPISVAELEEGATLIAHKVDEQVRGGCGQEPQSRTGVCSHLVGAGTYSPGGGRNDPSSTLIYNEMIRDLLNPSLGYLELREDSKGVIQVAGLTEVSTINAKEIMQLLMRGNRQRTQEPTAANQTSSRSHAVLQVTVRQRGRVRDVLQEVRQGRLFMIDLAGSERASQTQNRGQRMKEGAHINRSLLALGNCINALSDKGANKYVNYRDSKLTRLLKDSLGGNSRTVMIAHISPASSAFEESRNTLTYAGRAKSIKTRVKRNLLSVSYHIAQYTNIIADLRGEIQRLKRKMEERGGRSPDRAQLGRGDIRHIQAKVQLHSGQGEQTAMEHLREQLVSTFQEQMDTQRRLLELENRGMELEMDTSHHLLTIASWKHEKSRRALKWREERRKESFTKGDTRKDSDTGDNQPDIKEPAEVVSARESIATLMTKQKKLRKQKLALEQRCRELRARGRRLEQTLPRRVSSEQQREALGLLCRVHELELKNAEMQSQALLRDGALRHRREALRRLEQRRSLCEEIIRAQRQLIQDCNLAVPQHLKELYEVYLREQEEGNLERATMMDRLASRALQDSALPKLSPPGTVLTPEESDLDKVKIPNSESPHQHGSFLPLLGTESEAKHPVKTSSWAWQAKGSFMPTPPRIPAGNLVMQEAATQVGLIGQINSSPENIENLSEIPLSLKGRKETTADTKSITGKAARRRSQALGAEARQLLAPTIKQSSLSLHLLGETDDVQLPGPLACKRPPSPTLQHAASEDSLSSSTGEAPSRAVERHGDGPCPPLQGQKKSPRKKRKESLEAKRKRKSQGVEITGQGIPTQLPAHLALQPMKLSRPKMHVAGLCPVESHTTEERMPVIGHLTPTIRPLGKATLPMAKVKLPPCQNSGPEDTSPVAASSNPGDVSERVGRMPRLTCGTSTQGKNGCLRHN